jgi:hypothetical protein
MTAARRSLVGAMNREGYFVDIKLSYWKTGAKRKAMMLVEVEER